MLITSLAGAAARGDQPATPTDGNGKVAVTGAKGKRPTPATTKAPPAAPIPAPTLPLPESTTPAAPAVVAPAPAAPSAAADAADEKRVRRIAIYKLEGAGVDDRGLRVITDSLVAEVRKLQRTSVIGMDEIKAMLDLEAQKQLAGCGDVSCVAEIAEALGVDTIVVGNIAVVGDGISFGLKHIDQKKAQTLGQAVRRIDSKDPADVLAAIGPMVAELFPGVPLKPGAARGVAPEVALRIHPPPLQPWIFWSAMGVSATAMVAGGVFTTMNALSYTSADKRAKASTAGVDADGKALNGDIAAVRTSFVGLVAAYGVGVVVGAGAGVSALFTDWSGEAGGE